MSTHNSVIIYLCLWFLLPMIPAFVFYRVLPDRTWVNGIFNGLKINLSGAFAGYFLLFITAIPFMRVLIIIDDKQYEVWTIKGKAEQEDNKSLPQYFNPKLSFVPSNEIQNGEFNFLVVGERKGKNTISFPALQIIADSFVTYSLERLDYKLGRKVKKELWLMDCDDKVATYPTIKLKRISKLANENIEYVQEDK